jgi:hypothetical protein
MFLRAFSVMLTAVLFAGCASNPMLPLPLADGFYNQNTAKVGLYFDELPKTNTTFPGAGCLLCLAAAAAANSSLTGYVKTLPQTEIASIPQEVMEILTANNVSAIAIDTPINFKKLKKVKAKNAGAYFAPQDMRPLKQQLNIDQLLVIDFNFVGVQRNYSSYIPNGSPQASIQGLVYLVDLTTNTYTMYQPINWLVPVQGEWDEPPSFPGVTTAYYDALDRAKSQVLKIFKK